MLSGASPRRSRMLTGAVLRRLCCFRASGLTRSNSLEMTVSVNRGISGLRPPADGRSVRGSMPSMVLSKWDETMPTVDSASDSTAALPSGVRFRGADCALFGARCGVSVGMQCRSGRGGVHCWCPWLTATAVCSRIGSFWNAMSDTTDTTEIGEACPFVLSASTCRGAAATSAVRASQAGFSRFILFPPSFEAGLLLRFRRSGGACAADLLAFSEAAASVDG